MSKNFIKKFKSVRKETNPRKLISQKSLHKCHKMWVHDLVPPPQCLVMCGFFFSQICQDTGGLLALSGWWQGYKTSCKMWESLTRLPGPRCQECPCWLSSLVMENVDPEGRLSSKLTPPVSVCVTPIILTLCMLLLTWLVPNYVSSY